MKPTRLTISRQIGLGFTLLLLMISCGGGIATWRLFVSATPPAATALAAPSLATPPAATGAPATATVSATRPAEGIIWAWLVGGSTAAAFLIGVAASWWISSHVNRTLDRKSTRLNSSH